MNHINAIRCALLALALFKAPACLANCVANAGFPAVVTYGPTLLVDRGLGLGDPIPGTVRTFEASGTCTRDRNGPAPRVPTEGAEIVVCTRSNGSTAVPGLPGVYTTGIQGVGMAIRDKYGNRVINAQGEQCHSVFDYLTASGDPVRPLAYQVSGSVELVKTTDAGVPVGGGTLNPSLYQFLFGVYETLWLLNGSINSNPAAVMPSGNITIASVTCAADYPARTYLPTVDRAALPGVGSAAGDTRFRIGLVCDQRTRVGITMNAAPGVEVRDAANGVIGLLNEGAVGVARGFGLRITQGQPSQAVPLRVRNEFADLAAGVRREREYVVSYWRSATTTQSGVVESAVVVTFDYQ